MRRWLCLGLIAFVACTGDDDFPTGDPPDDTVISDSTGPVDAGEDDGDGGPSASGIRGSVCLVNDVRFPGTCDSLAGQAITVSVDGTAVSTTIDAMGRFVLPARPAGTERATLVAREAAPTDLAPAAVTARLDASGSASNVTLRIISAEYLDTILATNLLPFQEGAGQLFVRVLDKDAQPVDDVELSIVGVDEPFYDAGERDLFVQFGPTGPTGFGAYLNIPAAGAFSFSITRQSGADEQFYNQPILADGVVFYTAIYDPAE